MFLRSVIVTGRENSNVFYLHKKSRHPATASQSATNLQFWSANQWAAIWLYFGRHFKGFCLFQKYFFIIYNDFGVGTRLFRENVPKCFFCKYMQNI